MKNLYGLFTGLLLSSFCNAQVVIPDPVFKSLLLSANASNEIAKNLSGVYFKIDANSDGQIQFSEAGQVGELFIYDADVASLTGLEAFTNLTNLVCDQTDITLVDASPLIHLKRFYFRYSPITSAIVANLSELEEVTILTTSLPQIDLSGLPSLNLLQLAENDLTSLDLSGAPNLERLWFNNEDIQSALDLSNRPALKRVEILYVPIPSINLTGSTNLDILHLETTQISNIDLTGLNTLTWFAFNNNPVNSVSLPSMPYLWMLQLCGDNLNTVDLSPVPNLTDLYIYNNNLTAINLSPVPNLQWLGLSENNFTQVDLSPVPNVKYFVMENSPLLIDVDVSMMSQLSMFIVRDNPVLQSINLKNGIIEPGEVVFSNNPQLQYVCADEGQLAALQSYLTGIGQPSVSVNSYCSFVPGGVNYTITGNSRFDLQNDGCDASDIPVPGLFFTVWGSAGTGALISGSDGTYSLGVSAGTHNMAPVLENPQYFLVSPTSSTFTFPTLPSPATKDYCLHATGTYNDLEVVIIPVTAAVPGFEQTFLIKYKNKGNTMLDGSVVFQFADDLSDYIWASQAPSSQNLGQLSWDFQNLAPFQSGEITVKLEHNTPTDSPPLHAGDDMGFSATISPYENDAMVIDNTFTLRLVAVNSLDPNDKTCLEGSIVSPDMAGQYVHYLIRFENTGTAPAHTIVVRDMIDTSKFVVTSLVPLASSHPFYTRVIGANRVEFIFEGIDLPFDDAHNDGFVAFKIKTKPTLMAGNSFSNSAGIYFDFNLPIVTNTATTTIQLLNNEDFVTGNYTLYPNPVTHVLNISHRNGVVAHSANIYNIIGQRLISASDDNGIETIDVSSLASGSYIIELFSETGSLKSKFIKN